ncbi:MAG: glycosyltransferase family 92 protein, partial [Actinomycetota bacterium]
MPEAAQSKPLHRRMLSGLKRLVLTAHLIWRRFTTQQRWTLGVCAVFKNESRHLEEWLEFHSLMGAEHFFLYDDRSSDEFMTVLQPWIDNGRVTLRPSKGRKQKVIYNHCLRHGAARCRWIAFIDLDEFLFSPEAVTLPVALERYSSVPAVFVHWILFGSGGHVQAPQGGTIDSYTMSLGREASIRDDFDHQKGGPRDQY